MLKYSEQEIRDHITRYGVRLSHSFPYDHDNSLDSNLQSVNEKLNEMEQYQKEEVEYSGGMHR